ncbi:2963_t:CDS:2, partial [Acaulospora colombiana]
MSYPGILSALLGIILLSVHVNSVCQHYNATCPEWMQYGVVSARIKTGSTSLGVVSSFVISNNTIETYGDEIDYEWVGLNRNEVQSNYYWNGTLNFTNGMHHSLAFDTTQDFHVYTVDWKPDYIR